MGSNMLFQMMMKTMMQQNPQLKQMIDMFQQFKGQHNAKDAEAEVKKLLSSGQMSQEQFEQLKTMAQQYSNFLK